MSDCICRVRNLKIAFTCAVDAPDMPPEYQPRLLEPSKHKNDKAHDASAHRFTREMHARGIVFIT